LTLIDLKSQEKAEEEGRKIIMLEWYPIKKLRHDKFIWS